MKKMKLNKYSLLLISVFFIFPYSGSVGQEKSAPKELVKLQYFNNNNRVQYLILESTLKENKVISPRINMEYQLYLDSITKGTLIAKLKTDKNGKAKAFIPPSLKNNWNGAAQHTFIVTSGEEEIISDFLITRSRITLDTATSDGVKNITVSVMKWENNTWIPSPEVELKVGIARTGGSILPAGDEETYTTDSSGTVAVDLKKDSLPGDLKGNYVLAARADDNEELGNLLIERTVPWGLVTKTDNSFFQKRTLWTTRFRTPLWLLFMAYSIVIGVWGTIIYLIVQLYKIIKLGDTPTAKYHTDKSKSEIHLTDLVEKT